ncbi:MAG: FeoB-associated Cys-rich membrane protein [Bacilli bacterium]
MSLIDIIILIVVVLIVALVLFFSIRSFIKEGACASCSKKNRCIAKDKEYFKKLKEKIKSDEE